MNRNIFSSIAHRLCWIVTCAVFVFGLAASRAADRPNIVFLLTDDQRFDTLATYGNRIIRTPNIDRLASEGVTFNNAFVTTAICMTSRATFFTGQYAARHGVWNFSKELTPEQLAQTYPGVLKAAGYRAGFIGKWGVGRPPEGFLDYNKGFPGQGQYLQEIDGRQRHLTSIMGDQALEFLNSANADGPFCLSISFKAPHVQDTRDVHAQAFPFDPELSSLYEDIHIPQPETADNRYFEKLPVFLQDSEARARWAVRFWGPDRYQFSVKSYYRLITGVDVVVGRIRETLEQIGAAENTIIVFTSDNGFFLGEYGLAGKWFPHDIAMRIPMMIMDPRLPDERRGTRREEMVLNIDVAPTLLDMADAATPELMQGRSLLPLVRGESPDWRQEFFYEHLFNHPGLPKSEAVRTRDWKYMRYVETGPLHEELYDLAHDPDETSNLAGEAAHASVLNEMREKHARLRAAAR